MSHCDDCQTAGQADCTCLCDGCTAARSDIILGRFAELAEARKDPELTDADLAVFAPRSEEPESVTDRLAKLALEMRDHTVRMRKNQLVTPQMHVDLTRIDEDLERILRALGGLS